MAMSPRGRSAPFPDSAPPVPFLTSSPTPPSLSLSAVVCTAGSLRRAAWPLARFLPAGGCGSRRCVGNGSVANASCPPPRGCAATRRRRAVR
eukprot:752483-Pleurochrysis_carterae.AAC.1